MTPPDEPPRWQALSIGPGGLPADQVRPSGPGAPDWTAIGGLLGHYLPTPSGPAPEPPTPGHRVGVRIALGLLVLAVVVGTALWVNANPLRTASSKLAVGDCVSSTTQRIQNVVPCSDDAADFVLVGRYDSDDSSECSASPSDVAVVLGGPVVLCLDYVATVGQCLLAGIQATDVGKVACDSTETGVYKVNALLRNSIDPSGCPEDTTETLVHRYNSQVICLGTP